MPRQDFVQEFEHKTLVQVIKAFYSNNFSEEIEKIPENLISEPISGVKYSLDELRAIEKSRCQAAEGDLVNADDAPSCSLSESSKEAIERCSCQGPALSISKVACNKCVNNEYLVTPACQGCLARPCTSCPFGAIEFIDGHSHINQEKCKKCGICAKSCPYGAIVKRSAPCMDVCPVGAIQKDTEGTAVINHDKCIACGQCASACPFGAVMTRSQIIDVLTEIKKGKRVIAMLAPAIMGQFNGLPVGQILSAFCKAGFSDAVEVAIGADITTCNEAKELAERLEKGAPFMTTSCCPAYFTLVRKHIPELREYVSDTGTPMHYTAELLKKEDPDCVSVFIGPCMAKRDEGCLDEFVDYVLNNKEIEALFEALNIVPADCEPIEHQPASKQGRGFPLSGGVAAAVQSLKTCDVCPVAINGINKETFKQLKMYAKNKKADGNLVEVMACMGGCVAGPGVNAPVKKASKEIQDLMKESEELKECPLHF